MNDKRVRDDGSNEGKKTSKKECEHEPARIWLASSNYQEARYCRKCLEMLHANKRTRQESA